MIKLRLFIIFFCIMSFYAQVSFATDYYLCATGDGAGATDGSDWDNCYNGWSDISWAAVGANDTLYVDGGASSKSYGSVTVGSAGSSDSSRLVIKIGQDAGHNGTANFGSITFSNRAYVTIDGEYNEERNFVLSGAMTMQTTTDPLVRYVEFNGGSMAAQWGSDGRISHCYFHDQTGDTLISVAARNYQVTGYDQTLIDNNIFLLNRDAGGAGDGADGIQGCWGMTVEGNSFNSVVGTQGTNHMDYIQMQANYIIVKGNTFVGSSDSCIDYDTWNGQPHHHKIYNNVFILIRGGGIRYYGGGGNAFSTLTDVYIANNTFVDHTSGHQYCVSFYSWNAGSTTLTNVFIKNNLFYNNSGTVVYIEGQSGFTPADWNFDYNLINGGSISIEGAYTQTNSFTGTPSFVDYTYESETSDVDLAVDDTAAMDNGTDLSSYFTTDKDGNTRSGTWDIGAYEYESETPANAIQGVTIN